MSIPVLHIIDTFRAGGAERMAVNLVNGLLGSSFDPHLCVTRYLGPLQNEINPKVSFVYLERRHRWDIRAIKRCVSYIRKYEIQILHAHSTSVFFALFIAMLVPHLSVLWHVHGVNMKMHFLNKRFYQWAAQNSRAVVCVSLELVKWIKGLQVPSDRIWYLPNFIPFTNNHVCENGFELPGGDLTKVVCVSNLRHPKDHFTLLTAWEIVLKKYQQACMILIGGIGEQRYARKVNEYLKNPLFNGRAFWIGARSNVPDLLKKCQIGVLSSRSEGFPVTLLEYGFAHLGVVATDVGQCADILDHGRAGLIVPPGDAKALADALIRLLSDAPYSDDLGNRLNKRVIENYSQDTILQQLSDIYTLIVQN